MNKKLLKTATVLMTVMLSFPGLAACGNGGGADISFDDSGNIIPSDNTTIINFWGWADKYEEEVFTEIVNNFNAKYDGVIKVNYTAKSSSGYSDNFVVNMISGPDVAYADEKYFKTYAEQGAIYDVTEFYNQSVQNYITSGGANGLDANDMLPYSIDRFRYNVETTTSEKTDPLYGVAKGLAPTGIFFNKKFFNEAEITIINETEESIREYNAAHPTNKKKIKAFYEEDGQYYFNKAIAMNWEECVELSRKLMNDGGAQYGYASEWWFNYGFSVGGDCIEYVPTTDEAYNGGYWEFTLADESKNYIVKDDATAITVNGNTYQAGEIIEYNDKKLLSDAQKASCNELPSQREAFTEFVRLSQGTDALIDNVSGVYTDVSDFYGADANGNIYGYGITPSQQELSDSKNAYFTSGKVAMVMAEVVVQRQYKDNMTGENQFDVAPALVYKEYSADGTEVLVHGAEGAHSGSVGIVMNANTKNPNAAWLFMEYIASKEGQSIQGKGGFTVPYYKSIAYDEEGVFLTSNYAADNAIVLAKATAYEKPGDWWYLKNNKWIDDWAGVLNSEVRNGKMSLTQFYQSSEFKATQGLLNAYTAK